MVQAQGWSRRVEQDRLLLVEGRDEVNLFEAIRNSLALVRPQVIDGGGKDQIPGRLAALLADANTRSIDVTFVGVARDANGDGHSAFRSVQGTLRRLDLPVPAQPVQVAGSDDEAPNTAILIIPDVDTPGDIETLCWEAVREGTSAPCVVGYVDCLKKRDAMESKSESKTLVHAYLASQEDPTTSVGLGAIKGYWPLEANAFEGVRHFIRLVAGTDVD